MKFSRSEQEQTERALRKGNTAREERLSVTMGKEEEARVDHAQREAQELGRMLVVAIPAIDQAMEHAAAQERARCLAICGQWPDNLMAKHLAGLIRGGK